MKYDISDLKIIEKILSTRKHERFMKYCWQNHSEEFLIGIHTHYICELIDLAFQRYREGKSTFYVITVPFRHGKSDCVSRYLPPHFLGEFPDSEVLLATYALNLSYSFSKFCRNLVKSNEYKDLYPNIEISKDSTSVQQWNLKGNLGGMGAGALGAGLTGKGYHLGILDDFCNSRADAESYTLREKAWEHFTNDFLTRRAPVSITIILATPWHTDDIIGRIKSKINPNSENYDSNFPKFKIISFPAKNGNIELRLKNKNGELYTEHICYDYLFLERFSKEWYEQHFAELGEYAASALLQCSPTVRGGNLIKVDKIQIHDNEKYFPVVKYWRVWDLAHTEKQTQKDDPDWTSGTLLAYIKQNDIWELWIKDVARIRANAPERDNFIRQIAEKDGQGVGIAVETSVDSCDTYQALKVILQGKRIIKGIRTKGDKVARMSYVEPIFEGSNVHILRGEWNRDWRQELSDFPSGKHDDQVDNLSAGYTLCCQNTSKISTGRVLGV